MDAVRKNLMLQSNLCIVVTVLCKWVMDMSAHCTFDPSMQLKFPNLFITTTNMVESILLS